MRKSFAHFRPALYAPLAAGMLLLTACASLPPRVAELDGAKQALASAEAVDAEQYAPDALASARSALQRAQAAMAQGKQADARDAALSAGVDAAQARVRSQAARSRAELRQHQAEIAELRARLQIEAAPVAGSPLDMPVIAASAAQRLQALEADMRLNPFAQFERLQARQAIDELATARRRDLPTALARAEKRVDIAEQAARIEAARREVDRLERERSELLVEASRRDAERARAEAEQLRLQAQLQAEEAERLRAQAQNVEAALDDAQLAQQDKLAAARKKEAALARKEAELLAGAKLPPQRSDARGEVFTLAGDAFASGQAQLTKAAAASVKALGLYLSNVPGGAVKVLGHTDSQGSAASNLSLSERRAQQVRASLVAAGLARSRVSAEGMGAGQPVADNGSASGRAKNRRVEIVVEESL